MFLSSYKNTCESFGELQQAVVTLDVNKYPNGAPVTSLNPRLSSPPRNIYAPTTFTLFLFYLIIMIFVCFFFLHREGDLSY